VEESDILHATSIRKEPMIHRWFNLRFMLEYIHGIGGRLLVIVAGVGVFPRRKVPPACASLWRYSVPTDPLDYEFDFLYRIAHFTLAGPILRASLVVFEGRLLC
jgi:hypothetical protein